MKITPVDQKLYLTEVYGALTKKNDVIHIDTRHIADIHLYRLEVSFGNDKYEPVDSNKIVIPDFKDGKEYVIIKLKMINSATGKETIFVSDEVNLTKYYYLGQPIEDVYPQILGSLFIRVDKLEKEVKDLKEKGDIL